MIDAMTLETVIDAMTLSLTITISSLFSWANIQYRMKVVTYGKPLSTKM